MVGGWIADAVVMVGAVGVVVIVVVVVVVVVVGVDVGGILVVCGHFCWFFFEIFG